MFSVTDRVKNVNQPRKGYLPVKLFTEEQFYDGHILEKANAAVASIQGMAVDYLTRYMIGDTKERAFSVSLRGAQSISEKEYEKAKQLLMKINGLDDNSIECACFLVGYDVAARRRPECFSGVNKALIDSCLISNIRVMVQRGCDFFKKNGPIVQSGFLLGGYNDIVSSGDGDYLTTDSIWDFKVSAHSIDSKQTLQLAMYYIMGVCSEKETRSASGFRNVKNLGIFNPFLNKAYRLDVSTVGDSVFAQICRRVIGYITPEDKYWRLSEGTNLELRDKIINQAMLDDYLDTGFRPDDYEDGIYEISVDDYWSFYRTIQDNTKQLNSKPKFSRTKSIRFLKSNGYIMFVSVSAKGKACVMDGGFLRTLDKPIEYYYHRMGEYGNLVLSRFSAYWDALRYISEQIQTIESIAPKNSEEAKKQYRQYKDQCKENGLVPLPPKAWHEKICSPHFFDADYVGRIHGCIVDIDFFNHIFLNPFDGTLSPYYAKSTAEKYFFKNLSSMLITRRPDLLASYEQRCLLISSDQKTLLNGTGENRYALIAAEGDTLQILQNGIDSNSNGPVGDIAELVLDTSMYRISRIMKALQPIYENYLIAVWYDEILPHFEIGSC